jgi:hypothetical protein
MNLTREEFARAVGISLATEWRMRRANRLPHYRICGRVLYSPRHIEEFLESCERPSRRHGSPGDNQASSAFTCKAGG